MWMVTSMEAPVELSVPLPMGSFVELPLKSGFAEEERVLKKGSLSGAVHAPMRLESMPASPLETLCGPRPQGFISRCALVVYAFGVWLPPPLRCRDAQARQCGLRRQKGYTPPRFRPETAASSFSAIRLKAEARPFGHSPRAKYGGKCSSRK